MWGVEAYRPADLSRVIILFICLSRQTIPAQCSYKQTICLFAVNRLVLLLPVRIGPHRTRIILGPTDNSDLFATDK